MKDLRRRLTWLVVIASLVWLAVLNLWRQYALLSAEQAELAEVLEVAANLEGASVASGTVVLGERLLSAKQRLAASDDHRDVLTARLRQLFAELELEAPVVEPWQLRPDPPATPRGETPKVVMREQRVVLEGDFRHLMDAIHSLESWPDQLRVRQLEVEPQQPGRVRATARLALASRAPPPETP